MKRALVHWLCLGLLGSVFTLAAVGCAQEYQGTDNIVVCGEVIFLDKDRSNIYPVFFFQSWFPVFLCNGKPGPGVSCVHNALTPQGSCLRKYIYSYPIPRS